jgi:hypothetical protein
MEKEKEQYRKEVQKTMQTNIEGQKDSYLNQIKQKELKVSFLLLFINE